MLRAHRFQLRLKPLQEAQLRRFLGMARWVWNQALAEQKARHERGEKYANAIEMAHWLTVWRNATETSWLSEGPVHTQQQVKLAAVGGQVIAVNPAYTSRTCRLCGHEAAENRVSQAQFQCVACGHAEHADIHAAKNILAAGHAVWLLQKEAVACGGVVRRKSARKRATGAAPMKQEPSEAISHG